MTHYHDSSDSEDSSAEANGSYVISLYDGIGCLAYDIKNKLDFTIEGPATNSGHRNPPSHIPYFEKKQLFNLGPDLPHS